jgi:hypothetical protein
MTATGPLAHAHCKEPSCGERSNGEAKEHAPAVPTQGVHPDELPSRQGTELLPCVSKG